MFKNLSHSIILKDTLYILGGKAVAMLLYMAFDISCARILKPEDYAEWVFYFAILTMMFYVGWCGINTSAKVFVSKESEMENINRVIRASFWLRLFVSFIIAVLITAIAYPLAKWLGYPERYPNLYSLCFFAGVLVFFNSISEFFKELFMGLGKFANLCFITILEYLGYFLFSLLFLLVLKKTKAAVLGYACSGVFVLLFNVIYFQNLMGWSKPDQLKSYQPVMKAVFKYAIPIAVSSIGGMILVEMDTLMLGILSTKTQVASYGIAKSLCSKATHINYALAAGSMTSLSVLTSENIRDKRAKLHKTSSLNILIVILVAGIFLLAGSNLIEIMYGAMYMEAAKILKYLLPYYAMYSTSTFFGMFLDFQGKAKIKSVCYFSVVFLNLILNLVFIPKIGAIGAALATSVSLIPYTVLVIVITAKVLKDINKESF